MTDRNVPFQDTLERYKEMQQELVKCQNLLLRVCQCPDDIDNWLDDIHKYLKEKGL